jgi:hypothetical protein
MSRDEISDHCLCDKCSGDDCEGLKEMQERAIRKQERELVLDELIDELPNVERSFGGEQIDTYIETHELKELVQSLRQQEEA